MINTSTNIYDSEKNIPGISLLVLVVFIYMGLFVGDFFSVVFSLLFSELSLDELLRIDTPPFTEDKRIPLLMNQGFSAFCGFILSGGAYLMVVEKKSPFIMFNMKQLDMKEAFLAIFIVLSFMMVNSFFVEWNMNVEFPAFLNGFENWASVKEEKRQMVTEFITSFGSSGQFFVAIIIMVIIASVGEEYLFRGIIQNKLTQYLKNPHIAIWLAAIIFSVIHFQFFGFVPRMFFGVVFGYLYYWSANLWIPIIAHIINNGFMLTMLYMYQKGLTGFDIDEPLNLTWYYLTLFGLLTGFSLYYFKRYTVSVKTRSE